jgi:hypothetical protein
MPSVSEVLTSLIKKHGGNKSEIARKLGLRPDGKPVYSSQLIGQYADGVSEPKLKFYKRWKDVLKDDIESLVETNVSRETEKQPVMEVVKDNKVLDDKDWYRDTIQTLIHKNGETIRETFEELRASKREVIEELKKEKQKLHEHLHELILRVNSPQDANQ